MSAILVTGANGFVGRALCRVLLEAGHTVTGLVRHAGVGVNGVREWVDERADFAGISAAWPVDVAVDCVVHLAARVHQLHDEALDPDAAFRATNVTGALRVAQAARNQGARRLVFVSSIKAVAESDGGQPLSERTLASPQDAYGRSKLEAEQALREYGVQSGLEIVIVRPPLVYGPEVRANFLHLMDAVWKRLPLPLGSIQARRSLVFAGNLADALACCVNDPRAAGACFHVADPHAPTVAELVRSLGVHLQRPARLLPVPTAALLLAGRITGRLPQIERLTGSLQVDATQIQTVLGWRPPYSLDDGLAATARWYRSTH